MDFQALLEALRCGDIGTAKQWVTKRAKDVDSDVDPQFGAGALHWACSSGQEEVVQALLHSGANPNLPNAYQATPLHWACKQGSLTLVELLVQHKGDPTLCDVEGISAMDLARRATAPPKLLAYLMDQLTPNAAPDLENNPKGARGSARAKKKLPSPSPTAGTERKGDPEEEEEDTKGPATEDEEGYVEAESVGEPEEVVVMVEPVKKPGGPWKAGKVTTMEMLMTPSSIKNLAGPPSEMGVNTSAISQQATTGVIPALQRAKVKLELELKHAQKVAEALRREVSSLQVEKLQLESKVNVSSEQKRRLDALQREKLELESQLKQLSVLHSDRMRSFQRTPSPSTGLPRPSKAKELEQKLKVLEQQHEKCGDEKHGLRLELDKVREEKLQELGAKDGELGAMQTTLLEVQQELVRLKDENKAHSQTIAELKASSAELQKQKSLAEVEARALAETQSALAAAQAQRSALEKQLRDQTREKEAALTTLGQAKAQLELANQQCEEKVAVENRLRQAEFELQDCSSRCGSLERQLESSVARIKELVQSELKLREMERELENTKVKVTSLTRQTESNEAKLTEQMKVNEELRQQLTQSSQDHSAEVSSAQATADELRQQLSQTSSATEEQAGLRRRAEAELEVLRTELKTLRELQAEVTSQKLIQNAPDSESAKAFQALRSNYETISKEKHQLAEQLLAAQQQITSMRASSRATEGLVEEKAYLTQQLKQLSQVNQATEQEKLDLQMELRKQESSLSTLTTQLQALQRQKSTLEEELTTLKHYEAEYLGLEQRRVEAEVQLRAKVLTIEELKAELSTVKLEKDSAEEQLSGLQDLRQGYDSLSRELGVVQEKLRLTEAEAERASEAHRHSLEHSRLTLEKERQQHLQKVQALESQKNATQSEMKALVEQLMEAQETVAQLTQSHVEDKANTLMQVQAKLDKMNSKMAQLESEKAEVEATLKQKDQAIQQLQALVEMMESGKSTAEQAMEGKALQVQAKDQELTQMSALAMDLKARLKAIEGHLEETAKAHRAELEALQQHYHSETERVKAMAHEQLREIQREAHSEIEALRVQSSLLERQKQGLELQVKALQDHISTMIAEVTAKRATSDKLFTRGLVFDMDPLARITPSGGGAQAVARDRASSDRLPWSSTFPLSSAGNGGTGPTRTGYGLSVPSEAFLSSTATELPGASLQPLAARGLPPLPHTTVSQPFSFTSSSSAPSSSSTSAYFGGGSGSGEQGVDYPLPSSGGSEGRLLRMDSGGPPREPLKALR